MSLRRPRALVFCRAVVLALALAGCAGARSVPASQPPAAGAQSAAAAPALCTRHPQPPPSEVVGTPGYWQFALSVVSPSGYPMTGLTKSDFSAAIGGRSVPIAYCREESGAPASVVLVVDPSLTRNPEAVRKSAGIFLERLDPCDEVGLIGPSNLGFVAQPMTTDHALVASRLKLLHGFGVTRIYESIEAALTMLAHARYSRRAVALITEHNGDYFRLIGDNPYGPLLKELLGEVQHSGVRVYAIRIHNPELEASLARVKESSGGGIKVVKAPTLDELASASGGAVVTVPPVDAGEVRPLLVAATGLARSVDHEYSIGLTGPTRPSHSVEIRLASAPETQLVARPVDPQTGAVISTATAGKSCPPVVEGPATAMRGEPGFAEFAVAVTDSSGKPVVGLKQSDFSVSANGRALPLNYFRDDEHSPASIVVVLDDSASMWTKLIVNPGSKLGRVRGAISKVTSQLSPCDEVAAVAFGGSPVLANSSGSLFQPFTTRHSVPLRLLENIAPIGESRLYDGIHVGLDIAATAAYPRCALILITDWIDTASRIKREDALTALARSGAAIYAIGIGDPIVAGGGFDRVNASAVKQLAEASGGGAFIVKPLAKDEGAGFVAALAKIIDAIDHGYTIGVMMPLAAGSAAPPEIRVAGHLGAVVTARRLGPAPDPRSQHTQRVLSF